VLATEYSGFDINKATTDVNSLILAHSDLKLMIAADGPDGQAAAAALKQSGKAGQIALIAFDAVPAEVAALKDGTISALIAQAPGKIGSESIKALVDYITANPSGGAVAVDGEETIESGLLTKANVDDPANADYVYKAQC
jgi:ribose transport system substrate-binding protein